MVWWHLCTAGHNVTACNNNIHLTVGCIYCRRCWRAEFAISSPNCRPSYEGWHRMFWRHCSSYRMTQWYLWHSSSLLLLSCKRLVLFCWKWLQDCDTVQHETLLNSSMLCNFWTRKAGPKATLVIVLVISYLRVQYPKGFLNMQRNATKLCIHICADNAHRSTTSDFSLIF